MNPILFAKNETDFTTNGLGRLECISCKVVEERNGMYELEAEIPVNGRHASEIEQLSIIGAIPHDGGTLQAFTIYKITKPISGRFMVYARHISYRLSDIPAMPFSVVAGPTACADTLAGLKSHAVESCPFNFSTDITTPSPYVQKAPASIRQRLGGVEGSVIDQFGGEFEWDNFNVKLWKQRGRLANVTGISLRYGKNITDINQEEEIANTVTGVVPYWIDTDGNNLVTLTQNPKIIYSSHASEYPYHITQVLDLSGQYQNKPTEAQIRATAELYVNKSDFGIPKVSIKVSFVNLWETEEYKDIAPLERVQLCDEINVQFEKLGVSAIAKVVKTDYDVLKERYNSIEVGSIRTTLAQAVTDRDREIDTVYLENMTRVNTAIQNATAWLTSANGYVVAVKNQDGSWKELLFMDSNDPSTATNGIRINNNGIGFWRKSIDGGNVLDGPYTNAWTIDGNLVADFITTGILKDKNNVFSLNMNNGTLLMNSGTFKGNVTSASINSGNGTFEVTPAGVMKATVGQIGDLTLMGGELYKVGNYTIRAISYKSAGKAEKTVSFTSFLSSAFGINGTHDVYLDYTVTNAQNRILKMLIDRRYEGEDTWGYYGETTLDNTDGTHTTMITSINFALSYEYRFRFYFGAKTSSGTTYIRSIKLYANNAKIVSISESGIYGKFKGTLEGVVNTSSDCRIGGFDIDENTITKAFTGSDGVNVEILPGDLVLDASDTESIHIHSRTATMGLQADEDNWVTLMPAHLSAQSSGIVYTVNWESSDKRQKHDIKPLENKLSRDFIDGTETKSFVYNNSKGTHYGVLAQDARKLLDKLGETDSMLEHSIGTDNGKIKDIRTVNYNEYIPHLINYVKDLRAVVDRQQAKIDELRSGLNTLNEDLLRLNNAQ